MLGVSFGLGVLSNAKSMFEIKGTSAAFLTWCVCSGNLGFSLVFF